MNRRRIVICLCAGALALSSTGGSAAAIENPSNSAVLTPETDPNPDIEVIAKARGWTVEEAAAQQRAADAVGAVAVRIAAERPDIFVGSALSGMPGGAPTLYVKGAADAWVMGLVAKAAVPILVADKQPYSFLELEARAETVHHAVEAMGYRNIVTRVNITGGGAIPVEVAAQAGLSAKAADVLAAVPERLRPSVEVTVVDASGFQDTTAFGGMWMRDDGANLCTSGFTVHNLTTGTTGVTTAGHCAGINQIYHPGDGVHTTSKQAEHRGAYGDVEWHTTSATEEATFYAASSTVRAVLYLEARASISVGEQVCQYGRASNYRDCDLDVLDVSIECTIDKVYNNRLVQMTGKTSSLGDSGGPWFRDYRVFGSQKGWCGSRDAWSVADLYDEAINVQVAIYE